MSQILALRRVIEGVKAKQLPAILTFIDFKKAFDSIHRGKMIKILRAYDVPENLLSAIENIYSKTRAKITSPDGETEYFEILAGVLQGDTLAPYLFIIVLDYALRQALLGREELGLSLTLQQRRSRRFPAETITDLDFADDIALLCNEVEDAQEMLRRLENEAGNVGLKANGKKTKVMAFNQETEPEVYTNDGTLLEVVDDFKYLGSWVNNTEADITIRKALAWKACNGMGKVWKSSISRKLKLRFFEATVKVYSYTDARPGHSTASGRNS